MVGRLLSVLGDCGLELSAQEAADALWLASRLPDDATAPLARALGLGLGPGPGRPSPAAPRPAGEPEREPGVPAPRPSGPDPEWPPRPPAGEEPGSAGLHATAALPRGRAPRPAGQPALALRVPEEKALPAALRLGRALRPLKRHRAAAGPGGIDEEATAVAMAETGLPDVVPRPARERWLDLALAVDDGVSMLLWRRLCAELRALLERLGAFRNVRVYGLRTRGPGGPLLTTRPFASGGAVLDAATLTDPSGRTLVLVVSDGVGAMWRDGRMRAALERWARGGPVAVVHALPARMWAGSGIRAEDWEVTVRRPGAANDTWRVADPVLPPELAAFDGVPIPVLEPEPSAVAAWAELTASTGGSAVLPLLAPPRAPSAAAAAPGAPAADPVLRFRDAASPQAYRLASHLAAVAPVTVPVMRLVQAAVPGRVETAHLAEVFLGGLMRRSDHTAGDLPPQHRGFDFDERARAVLLDAVPAAELLSTGRAVADRLARLAGRSPDFPAWLAHPGGGGELAPAARPFARVGTALLAHLGVDGPPTAPGPDAGYDADAPLIRPQVLRAAPSAWRPLRGSDAPAVGPYGLLARNDAGANGISFTAEAPGGDRRVLIRTARPRGYSTARLMLSTERQALERMGGRHAPWVVDEGLRGDPPWLATELVTTRAGVPAPTLRAVCGTPGWSWHPRSFALLGWQLANAMSLCHLKGMVHRALSPDTVLVTEDRVTVVGWMAARIQGQERETAHTVLGDGQCLAPEASRAAQPTPRGAAQPTPRGAAGSTTKADENGRRMDVYALGATLALAAEGRMPQGMDPALAAVLQRCLNTDPAARPSARTVAEAFGRFLTPLPPRPTPPEPPGAGRRVHTVAVVDFSERAGRGTVPALLGIVRAEGGEAVVAVNAASSVTALDNRMRYTPEGPVRAEHLDFAGARAFVSKHRSGLEVLTYSPRAATPLAQDGFATVREALGRRYRTVIIDLGSGELALLMRRDAATGARLLLVADYDADGLQRVERALNWLSANGRARLAADAAVALAGGAHTPDRAGSFWAAEARVQGLCRAVVFLPHAPELSGGGELDGARLTQRSRQAYRLLATVTAEDGAAGGAGGAATGPR
jgi:hypothetical protein